MSLDLTETVASWDRDFEAALPVVGSDEKRQPYGRLLDSLDKLATIRFQRYENDHLPTFIEKLRVWLEQFPENERRAAFLLANRVIFVTERQFETLQRRLFQSRIRPHLLAAIIKQRGLEPYEYAKAMVDFDAEMDATIFVANSDSAQINSFVHRNSAYFTDRKRRNLVGPEVTFWTYASERARDPSLVVRNAAIEFDTRVLAADPRLGNKRRMVIIEDFSGTGSDLTHTLLLLDKSALPIQEIIVAPVIATEQAVRNLDRLIRLRLTKKRVYKVVAADILSEQLCCFDGRGPSYLSYLDGDDPVAHLSKEIRDVSERLFTAHFASATPQLTYNNRHGVGSLALAFVLYTNCPDNSLPLIWKTSGNWPHALFLRVSRIV